MSAAAAPPGGVWRAWQAGGRVRQALARWRGVLGAPAGGWGAAFLRGAGRVVGVSAAAGLNVHWQRAGLLSERVRQAERAGRAGRGETGEGGRVGGTCARAGVVVPVFLEC
jgi:hypothetical protein